MVAQKIPGTPTIRAASRNREAREAGAFVMKVAFAGGKSRSSSAGVMKARPNDLLLFAFADDRVNRFGALGQRQVHRRIDEARNRLVFLRAEGRDVFLVLGGDLSKLLSLRHRVAQRLFIQIMRRG